MKDPQGGWYTVDPTPATARAAGISRSPFEAMSAFFGRLWEKVVRFDDEMRTAAMAWLAGLPRDAAGAVADHAVAVAALVAAVAGAVVFVRRRRANRTPAAVREYAAAMRRLGVKPLPGETPRETAARAAVSGATAARAAEIDAVTRRHEAARYASRI